MGKTPARVPRYGGRTFRSAAGPDGPPDRPSTDDLFARWIAALEARHLADLRFSDVARALRALSSAYVERRGALYRGAALDGAGKRAAFALFYGPIHFLIARYIVAALRPRSPDAIIDLGCGTGAAGAVWALETGGRARLTGVDRHPWALQEARWTYRTLQLRGETKRVDVARARLPVRNTGIMAAFALNELKEPDRRAARHRLLAAAAHGAQVLVIEPVAKSTAPWWDEWREACVAAGGRADEWRFTAVLPRLVQQLDRAAGLNHRVLTARSLFVGRADLPPSLKLRRTAEALAEAVRSASREAGVDARVNG